MKKVILALLSITRSNFCFSQTYVAIGPAVTNDIGTLAEKSNMTFEIGRQWDVFSGGLDYGKTTLAKQNLKDTASYFEFRPNLNIFQQGKFTNTFTAGIGYIFNAKQNLMTELTSGIEYAATDTWHINLYFGQYYYSGRFAASSVTFFGASFMYYFKPMHAKSLIQKK